MEGGIILTGLALLAQAFMFCLAGCLTAYAADVIIVGDTQFKPVADVVAEIKHTLRTPASVHATTAIRGRLAGIVQEEAAKLVVALGKDALDEAMRLPASVAVIYGLVIVPPHASRANLTGVYMSTPSSEYVSLMRKHFPSLRKISIIGSREMLKILDGNGLTHVAAHQVSSSTELVSTVSRLDDMQALVLLPDISLLTTTVMEQMFLYSFRKKIPLLGISESNVRQGALCALVFEPSGLGRQLGEMAAAVVNGAGAGMIPQAAPRTYNLYLNVATARKMGISVPDELIRRAKRVY